MTTATLRVATFNVRNGRAWDGLNSWPLRRRSTADAIADLDVDVIGLQEVFGFQRRYLANRTGGTWVGRGRGGSMGGEQCPVACLTDAVGIDAETTRWFGATPDQPGSRLPGASFPRIATIVDCRMQATGATFRLVNVHLDEHVAENRAASTTQVVEWVGDTAAIILGDFNTTPDDVAVFAPLGDAGFHRAPVEAGTNHDFEGGEGKRVIDQIWFSAAWRVDDAEVVHTRPRGRLPSDHWPVRAVATLTS